MIWAAWLVVYCDYLKIKKIKKNKKNLSNIYSFIIMPFGYQLFWSRNYDLHSQKKKKKKKSNYDL